MKVEYTKLIERKTTSQMEYAKLKKQVREYEIVKRNVGNIIHPADSRSNVKRRNEVIY